MTPQLQQAIKLLQLGREDYLEEMEKALLENPVLEDQREEDRYVPPTSSEQQLESAPKDNNLLSNEDSSKGEKSADSDFANIFDLYNDSTSTTTYGNKSTDWDDERPSLESTLSARKGLAEHLMWQLRDSQLSNLEKEIASILIGNLDKNGYLAVPLEEIIGTHPIDVVEKVLLELQLFDPIGVGARDLRECLTAQLCALGQGESLAAKIVDKHLPKLETRKYEAIARDFGIQLQEVYEAVKLIQKLEPRPGRPFVDEEPIYITPDIFVRKIEGEWRVSLNEAGMPKLRISKSYQELLERKDKERKEEKEKSTSGDPEKEYLVERIKSASWLIRSVQQRQQTIHKVAESIMRFQPEFLEQGITALRPLVLREVAENVNMHESTVSRVTTNKYIHTPHGVYELKFFFSSGLNSEEGGISSESVKEKIRAIVAAENQSEPFSDQAIAAELKKDGIDIARRTVAKYREMLGILSSTVRKKAF
jgi:RNA polymerase sigma-54 factor